MKCALAGFIFTVIALCFSSAAANADVQIVRDGAPIAAIVMPTDAPAQVQDAAALLASYIEQSTAAKLPIISEGQPLPPGITASIHVGRTALAPEPGDLDDDGFIIAFLAPDIISIAGPTPWGTEFGVYEFLERFIGVRWLLPGSDGEDVPLHPNLTIPAAEIKDEPAYFSRLMSGWQTGQGDWSRRMRSHGRVGFHHNLVRLFPPETYTASHPEFFPMRNGKRFLPPNNDTHGWQPCFSNPTTIPEAIKNIKAYFATHPTATSYSLGVNDSGGHCECETCQALDTGEKNFIGSRDVSDRYFAWCNAVVEGVLEEYPDKWFGCLAYSEVAQPPSHVKIHPRIIPYMTYDRMKWIDPQLRADGEEMTRTWAEVSPTVGWYDYIYGTAYCVPRVYFHHMADYMRFGYENGVRAHYAEAYPNFGEGPKLYLALKLQWDPYLDVDALLDEWYECCVGAKAATYLKEYYTIWEDWWTSDVLDSNWFTTGGQYLPFHSPAYLKDVPMDAIHRSRTLLELAITNADTQKQRHRAELLLKSFEYYEASTIAYKASTETVDPVNSAEDALVLLNRGTEAMAYAEKRHHLADEELSTNPITILTDATRQHPELLGNNWGAEAFWRALDYATDPQSPVTVRLRELAALDGNVATHASAMLQLAVGTVPQVLGNTSFELGEGVAAEGWLQWVKWDTGRMVRTDEEACDGDFSLLCEGIMRGGPVQKFDFTPGRYVALCHAFSPDGSKVSGTCSLSVTLLDADGRNLPGAGETTFTPSIGSWQLHANVIDIPETAGGKPVAGARVIILLSRFEPGEKVYLDNLEVYRLAE